VTNEEQREHFTYLSLRAGVPNIKGSGCVLQLWTAEAREERAPPRAKGGGDARVGGRVRLGGHGGRRRERRASVGGLFGRLRYGSCGHGRSPGDRRCDAHARRAAQACRGCRALAFHRAIIKQNVLVSLLIKGLFVLLAPFGMVALWLAVLADMGTFIAVTLNGLQLFCWGRD
jgi:hypothetical protein